MNKERSLQTLKSLNPSNRLNLFNGFIDFFGRFDLIDLIVLIVFIGPRAAQPPDGIGIEDLRDGTDVVGGADAQFVLQLRHADGETAEVRGRRTVVSDGVRIGNGNGPGDVLQDVVAEVGVSF